VGRSQKQLKMGGRGGGVERGIEGMRRKKQSIEDLLNVGAGMGSQESKIEAGIMNSSFAQGQDGRG